MASQGQSVYRLWAGGQELWAVEADGQGSTSQGYFKTSDVSYVASPTLEM